MVNITDITDITEDDVITAVKKLKDKLTVGFLLKNCVGVLWTTILKIINLSLSTATFPTSWKSTRVCLIYKRVDTVHVTNCRPIAIVSNLAKLFEFILHSSIYSS